MLLVTRSFCSSLTFIISCIGCACCLLGEKSWRSVTLFPSSKLFSVLILFRMLTSNKSSLCVESEVDCFRFFFFSFFFLPLCSSDFFFSRFFFLLCSFSDSESDSLSELLESESELLDDFAFFFFRSFFFCFCCFFFFDFLIFSGISDRREEFQTS